MKSKYIIAAACAVALAASAHAQTVINITGATAFRTATINSIVAAYGGAANVGVVTSAASGSYTGSNAISFRGNFTTVGDTIIRCRFSGSTEGIRDLVGNGTTPNDVFFYDDAQIPAVGSVAYKNENSNPATANVARKPDLAFSDVQQNNTPFRTPVLSPADSRVGVITFVWAKSQGSSPNLTNVTAQNWRAALSNPRGVPLSLFTGVSSDSSGRVLTTGRNDGSGTRGAYLIESGYGVSRLVNHFKIGVSGKNGIATAGFTGDVINNLQLWPANDADDANNDSFIWNTRTNGNGGYFSSSNVSTLLQKDTSSIRVYGPTGAELSTGGTYVSTATTGPRAFSVIGFVGTNDGVNIISGGGDVLAYNGVKITPVNTSVDPTGLVPADRFKVTNGQYTAWTYERLFNRGTLSTNQNTVVYGAGGIVPSIPGALANSGIAISAMTAVRGNDGDVVTAP
jgi:hypothetical protein